MQDPSYSFRGFIFIRVSPDGKVRIPRYWSNRLTGRYFLELSREGEFCCIELLSEEILLAKAAEEMKMETNHNRELLEMSRHERREVSLDSLPNLILPLDWCKAAGIKSPGKLILAGKGNFLVFWSQAGFDAMIALVLNE